MREDILKLLAEKEMTVTEIAKALNISKSTVSYHIENLRKEGLIDIVREERVKNMIKRYYALKMPNDVGKKIVEEIGSVIEKKDKAEFFRNTLRLLGFAMLKTQPYLFKRIGFYVGYRIGFKGAGIEDLAEVWKRLDLGETSCSRDSLTVENCYLCSGLPNIGKPYCKFDEGFISGFLTKSKGENFKVKEVRCWGLGDELCEFRIRRI